LSVARGEVHCHVHKAPSAFCAQRATRNIAQFDWRSRGMTDRWIDDVIHFWFEELKPENWFARDERVDARIRERYENLYKRLRAVPSDSYATAQACLAAVIVLDQFPRNLYRNSPRAYQTDDQALSISQYAISCKLDQQMAAQRRMFLYMPWQHSESSLAQARSIELFTELDDKGALGYARRHKEVIDRFGRFPHRNAVLGRTSTTDEVEFMRMHKGF
jgi:uncharacterized protein (DUF924 family)